MPERLMDEDYARLAAAHALHPKPGVERLDRLEPLGIYDVHDEKSLARHALEVLSAEDTICFRGAFGREMYANDRLSTIVWINEEQPDRSTVHHNDDPERSASSRLTESADDDRVQYDLPCEIRVGGLRALENDRVSPHAERDHATKSIPTNERQADVDAMFAGLLKLAQDRDLERD